jgi:TRAP-type C4-dicarboxylate transport system substrate-binding protein
LSKTFDFEYEKDITLSGKKASSLIEMTRNNNIQVSYLWSSYYEKLLPEIQLLDLPFYFQNKKEVKDLIEIKFNGFVSEKLENNLNLKLLGFWDNGARHISTNRSFINDENSCTDLKIRTTPSKLHINIFNRLGFKSCPLDVRDFKKALSNSEIDAQENPLTNFWNFGVQNSQKYLTLSSHLFGFCLFVINHYFFNKLNELEKKLILEASKETINYQYKLAEEDDKKLIDMIKKENVQIYEMTNFEKNNLLRKVKDFHNKFFIKFPNMNFKL